MKYHHGVTHMLCTNSTVPVVSQHLLAKYIELFSSEHMNTISLTKRVQYTHPFEHLIFKNNLCNLPDTLNFDNFPPDSCIKEYFFRLKHNSIWFCQRLWSHFISHSLTNYPSRNWIQPQAIFCNYHFVFRNLEICITVHVNQYSVICIQDTFESDRLSHLCGHQKKENITQVFFTSKFKWFFTTWFSSSVPPKHLVFLLFILRPKTHNFLGYTGK